MTKKKKKKNSWEQENDEWKTEIKQDSSVGEFFRITQKQIHCLPAKSKRRHLTEPFEQKTKAKLTLATNQLPVSSIHWKQRGEIA